MCRMVGIIGTPPLALQETLKAFYPLCTQGRVKCGMKPGHLDGWGISGFNGGRAVYFERQAEPASQGESLYARTAERAGKSGTPVLVAHFRKVWGGKVGIPNTHPFHCRDWVFAHNGTIFGATASLPLNESQPQGDTDSERFLLWIWEQIHAAMDPTAELVSLLKASRDQFVFSALNFLLSDGKKLWAYRDFGDKRLEKGETIEERQTYYTLFTARLGKSAVVCSEPLPAVAKKWDPIAQRTLAVFTVENASPSLFKI